MSWPAPNSLDQTACNVNCSDQCRNTDTVQVKLGQAMACEPHHTKKTRQPKKMRTSQEPHNNNTQKSTQPIGTFTDNCQLYRILFFAIEKKNLQIKLKRFEEEWPLKNEKERDRFTGRFLLEKHKTVEAMR